jgi:hypothetical protein
VGAVKPVPFQRKSVFWGISENSAIFLPHTGRCMRKTRAVQVGAIDSTDRNSHTAKQSEKSNATIRAHYGSGKKFKLS